MVIVEKRSVLTNGTIQIRMLSSIVSESCSENVQMTNYDLNFKMHKTVLKLHFLNAQYS